MSVFKKIWCKVFGHDWYYWEIAPYELEPGEAGRNCRRCGLRENRPQQFFTQTDVYGNDLVLVGKVGRYDGIHIAQSDKPFREEAEQFLAEIEGKT